jgi:hypothetical protein
MTGKLVCEVHKDCKEEVAAKINLPGPHAQWACIKGYNEWREEQKRDADLSEQRRITES